MREREKIERKWRLREQEFKRKEIERKRRLSERESKERDHPHVLGSICVNSPECDC